MLKEYLNNFDMYKLNEVELVLDKNKISPSWVDFDFKISLIANSAPKAEITLYNLEIDIVSSIEIYCNKILAFNATQVDINKPNVTLDIITNELSIASKIECSNNSFSLSQILLKGEKFTYSYSNKRGKKKQETITLSNDYVFTSSDSEEAKIKTILTKEEKNNFKKAFFIEGSELYLFNNLDKVFDKSSLNFYVINELKGYGSEEVILTLLFTCLLKPLQIIQYKPKGAEEEYSYTVISVVNDFIYNKGLLQTVLLKRGKRLQLFLNAQKQPTNGGEYE